MCDYCDFTSSNRAALVICQPDLVSFAEAAFEGFAYLDGDKKLHVKNSNGESVTDEPVRYCFMCGRKL